MLTEELRVLAGLQESKSTYNPLPEFITEIQHEQEVQEQRKRNSTYNVASNFGLFKQKMNKMNSMVEMIMTLTADDKSSTFVNGIMESKYSKLKDFTDKVLNESITSGFLFLENNFNSIEKELLSINAINETEDEENSETFFVSNLITSKGSHGIRFSLYENKDLTDAIDAELVYGAQIISLTENITVVKQDGKKMYSTLSRNDLHQLEEQGLLL